MTLPRPLSTTDSLIARWDGRWKIAGLFFVGLSASTVMTLSAVGVALAIAVLLVLLARMSLRNCFVLASLLLVGILPLAIALPFLSSSGWLESLALVLRALAVGFIGHVALATAPPHRSFAALAALKVPRPFVMLLQFSYRYAMLIAGEVRRVRVSMAARGFRLRPTFHSSTSMGNLIGSVLVRSGDRAETIQRAMQARGFHGTTNSLDSFQTRSVDVLGFFGSLSAAVAIRLVEWFVH